MRHGKRAPSTRKVDGAVPALALTHGQAVWLMTRLGLDQGVSIGTFNYYIKSLRKLGIPFEKGKGQSEGHTHVTYDLEELMELAVALLLRVYGTLPDAISEGLRGYRDQLRPIYRQAFKELATHGRDNSRIIAPRGASLKVEGLFLDLNLRYCAGHMLEFGPPKAVSPFEAISAYAEATAPARSYLPINLSSVASRIIDQTQALPPRRRRATTPVSPAARIAQRRRH